MVLEDENGFFSVLIPVEKLDSYKLKVTWGDDTSPELEVPYVFEPLIKSKDYLKFGAYKLPPKLDYDRIQTIAKTIDVPLVLYGGSGLTDTDFKKAMCNRI